ncbi:unnamed protein product [Ascophyllum nodosum]
MSCSHLRHLFPIFMKTVAVEVIDCHQDWCGPCETLHPTFYKIYLETPESDDRCMFLEVDLEKFADRIQAILPKDCCVDLAGHGCMPFIVLLKAGAAVSTVLGCDAPAILREVNKHMPPLPSNAKDAEVD